MIVINIYYRNVNEQLARIDSSCQRVSQRINKMRRVCSFPNHYYILCQRDRNLFK